MKKLIVYAVLCILSANITLLAQSSIRIMDLKTLMVINADTTSIPSDSVDVQLKFKINNSSLAEKAHFCLGTSEGACNLDSNYANFTSNGTQYYVNYRNISQPIENYTANFIVRMLKNDFNSLKYVKLYVEGTSGQLSNILEIK